MSVNYAAIAGTYDRWRSYSPDVVKLICGLGGLTGAMNVLDIGCGTGSLGYQIHGQTGLQVTGVDQSLPMLSKADRACLRPVCATLDGSNLPFKDASFGAVIGTYCIHHVRNLRLLFGECFRILGAGTIMVLTSSHEQIDNYHPVLKEFFPGFTELEKRRFPEIGDVRSLLADAGFTDVSARTVLLERIVIDRAYLEKVEGKFVSTYHLLGKDDFDSGVKKLARFIENTPDPVCQEWRATLITARKNP